MPRFDEGNPQVAEALFGAVKSAKSDFDFVGGFAKWFYGFLHSLITFAATSFSFSLEVILRYNFGERYLSIARGLWTLAVVTVAFTFLGAGSDPIAGIWLALYVLCWFIHRFDILRRRLQGEAWHSWSNGVSYFLHWRYTSRIWVVEIILEPLVALLLAAIAFALGSTFWPVLALAGAGMFVKSWTLYEMARSALLDVVDRQIEAGNLTGALKKDAKPTETEGFVIPGASRWTSRERATVAKAYAELDPKLKAALDPVPEIELKPQPTASEPEVKVTRTWAPTDASGWADASASASPDDIPTPRPAPPEWSDDSDEDYVSFA